MRPLDHLLRNVHGTRYVQYGNHNRKHTVQVVQMAEVVGCWCYSCWPPSTDYHQMMVLSLELREQRSTFAAWARLPFLGQGCWRYEIHGWWKRGEDVCRSIQQSQTWKKQIFPRYPPLLYLHGLTERCQIFWFLRVSGTVHIKTVIFSFHNVIPSTSNLHCQK